MSRPLYIASCSFGKDSLATILLALENNEPLDRAVFAEVMFDKERGISGEVPEHIDWVYSTAIPKLESMGVKVDVVRSEKDYMYFFTNAVGGGQYKGKLYGFPIAKRCVINRECKINPIKKYYKQFSQPIVQYVGIAKDESERLGRIKGNKISLLDKYNYTEQMAMELCKKYDLLSPIYGMYHRNGCWFCPNVRMADLFLFKKQHPELWNELKELSYTPNLCSYGYKWGKTVQEIDSKLSYMQRLEDWNSRQLQIF